MKNKYFTTIHELGAGPGGKSSKVARYIKHNEVRAIAIRRRYIFPILDVIRKYEITKGYDWRQRLRGLKFLAIINQYKLER